MKTFYLAGSSKDRELISDLGDDLMCSGEWEWEWNWTRLDESPFKITEDSSAVTQALVQLAEPGLVLLDLEAAARADLFILYYNHKSVSLGGGVELGTRLAAKKPAHVVLKSPAAPHLFFKHPGVTVWEDWFSMLKNLNLLDHP
jgi:hypothetical protein